MTLVRVHISVSGFTEAEVCDGIPDLLDEFRERPWILRPAASWDSARGRLVVICHYEGDDPDSVRLAAFDEVWDCVIACIRFSSDGIHFDIEESAILRDS